MKLDHECVRDLMLYLEENLTLNDHLNLLNVEIKNYEQDVIIYTGMKLVEAGYITGYINGKAKFASDGIYNFPVSSLTFHGHNFLDSIRDDKVWSKTKDVISSFSSVSLRIIEHVASEILKTFIMNLL